MRIVLVLISFSLGAFAQNSSAVASPKAACGPKGVSFDVHNDVGANRHNSYVSFAVDPGEHHLCVALQGRFVGALRFISLVHFTAEPGKVYFFRTWPPSEGRPSVDLEPIDSDQGKFLVAEFPASTSHPKK